MVHLEKYF